MKRLTLLFCLLPWLAFAQVGGVAGPVGPPGYGPVGGCGGPVSSCAGPVVNPSISYVFDQLASYPAVGYSVRQDTGGQYLPAYDMTVRRSSDNAQTNIGFVGGLEDTATLANGNPLPAWLSFSNGVFTGTPPAAGTTNVSVTGTDAAIGTAATETFQITAQ